MRHIIFRVQRSLFRPGFADVKNCVMSGDRSWSASPSGSIITLTAIGGAANYLRYNEYVKLTFTADTLNGSRPAVKWDGAATSAIGTRKTW